jgi:hypothetical protein
LYGSASDVLSSPLQTNPHHHHQFKQPPPSLHQQNGISSSSSVTTSSNAYQITSMASNLRSKSPPSLHSPPMSPVSRTPQSPKSPRQRQSILNTNNNNNNNNNNTNNTIINSALKVANSVSRTFIYSFKSIIQIISTKTKIDFLFTTKKIYFFLQLFRPLQINIISFVVQI